MSSMQEDIQCAGSDTRPPMLDRTDFESWQQRIRLYCLGKDNGENIMKSIKEGPFQMGTVSDVITGGTEGAVQQGPVRARVLNDLSAEEKERYKADIRATNILLQGSQLQFFSASKHNASSKGASTFPPSPLKKVVASRVVGGTSLFLLYPLDYASTRLANDIRVVRKKSEREFSGDNQTYLCCWNNKKIHYLVQFVATRETTDLLFVTIAKEVILPKSGTKPKSKREMKLWFNDELFVGSPQAGGQALTEEEIAFWQIHMTTSTFTTLRQNGQKSNSRNGTVNVNGICGCANLKKQDNSDCVCIHHDDCMSSDTLCVSNSLNVVKSRAKPKKNKSKKDIWKPTGKVFTQIGYIWRPTGQTFTIVGNACPITSYPTNEGCLL
ncbi:hypothetical protein Tco_0842896 [Tanacetum coccineum]|uniref:Retrovirus-related Pol polyprotein from transposon TNT 1-94 n=1 Tax=Tanacetum coccineum TaxID=301880 RepID=A0ABQ5B297_9ASTR